MKVYMDTLEQRFDKEFNFMGIEHQLEGDALRQDLLAFIKGELSRKFCVDQNILLQVQRGQISTGKAKELIEAKFLSPLPQ